MIYQINAKTKVRYSGKNFVELSQCQNRYNYKSNLWGTFKQFQSIGKRVKAGEHAHAHVFQGFGTETIKDENGKLITKTYPLGYAPVFNLEQTI